MPLAGYLPYVDLDEQQLGAAPKEGHTRSNHALWDQIGLLHWVRHNVIYFGGDQTNVSLLAGDNEAAQALQLLVLSPHAKGKLVRSFARRQVSKILQRSHTLAQSN